MPEESMADVEGSFDMVEHSSIHVSTFLITWRRYR
jgi:hypothetical protein